MKRVWAFCISLIFCAAFLWGEEFTPGAIVLVLDNLRLRSTGSMDGAAIVTIQKGSLLEVIGTGKNETIDGIDSSWVKVKALESTQDKDGSFVQEETEGWCFGGYLTPVKGGKKYEICFPGVGTQSVVIDSIYEYNRDGKEIYTRTSDGFAALKSGLSMINRETRFTIKTVLVMNPGMNMIKTEMKFTGKLQTGVKNGMNMIKTETKFTGKLQAAVNNGMNMMKMETKFTGKLQTAMRFGMNMIKRENSFILKTLKTMNTGVNMMKTETGFMVKTPPAMKQ